MASPSGRRKRSGAVSHSKPDDQEHNANQRDDLKGQTAESDYVVIPGKASELEVQSPNESSSPAVAKKKSVTFDGDTDVGGYDHCFVGEIPDEYVCGICAKVRRSVRTCIHNF